MESIRYTPDIAEKRPDLTFIVSERGFEQDRRSFFHVEAGRIGLLANGRCICAHHTSSWMLRWEIPMKTPDQHHFARSLDISVLPAVVDRPPGRQYWISSL